MTLLLFVTTSLSRYCRTATAVDANLTFKDFLLSRNKLSNKATEFSIMFFNLILSRFKSILLTFVALFRRALCCFSRRRKRSFDDCEILNSVSVVQTDTRQSSSSNRQNRNDVRNSMSNRDKSKSKQKHSLSFQVDRDWNSWDDSPRTVEEHIEQYRQKITRPATPPEELPIDFFQVNSNSRQWKVC